MAKEMKTMKAIPKKAKNKDDLPNSGNLRRTGLKGELVSEDYRQKSIKKVEKEISSSKNKPAGLIKKILNTDRVLATPSRRKEFKQEEIEKPKRIVAAKNRLKELQTRR